LKVAIHRSAEARTPARPAAAVIALRPAATAALAQLPGTERVSSPADPAEREADAVARKVVRMPLPASAVPRPEPPAPTALTAGGGAPLPQNVRNFMEPRFRADFSRVRVHTGERAATLSRQLNAQAFTVGNQIFFAKDRFRPETEEGRELIAHELTHTIQQQAAVQRKQDAAVRERAPEHPQRLGLSDILDGLADLAANVPGYTLLTVVIGRNPINMRAVERNAVNLLRGFMGLIPGGELLFQVLERYGIVQRIGSWVGAQVDAMGITFQGLRDQFTSFTDSLSWRDIFSPGDVWERAKNIFAPTIRRITAFVSQLIAQAIAWLKETFLQPLSDFCREIPGYGLVTVLLGRDPFTNVAVPRTALNVVRAFAEFIPGGTEKVDQLVQSHALDRAYAWFLQETQARNLTWARVTGTFTRAWDSLHIEDVLHPIDTLQRMVGLFRPLLADLVSFAGAALMKLLELIFEFAMGAGGARVIAIFKRARETFNTIIRDPVGFLRNLLGAVGRGIRQFMSNILVHLRDGVIAWLAGPVARSGIQMPERWDLRGIIWFVLQILGLTWARVREKLVRLMGERAVAMLEGAFQLIQEIREKGLVQALRDRVTEFFGTLRDAALGAIRSFIQQRLVMAGITQLLSLLSPVGAVIQAIIKTYNTIMFFIQKINEILELVESIVNSIAAIAAGQIAAAANFVERTMARTIPVILDFLARFIGLGDVGAQVQSTIRGIQARVDGMLDRAVDWIKAQAAGLASRALGGDPNAPAGERVQRGLAEAVEVVNRYAGRPVGSLVLRPLLLPIKVRNRLRVLDVVARGNTWVVDAAASPGLTAPTSALVAPTTLRTHVAYTPGALTAKSTEVYAFPLTHLEGTSPNAQGSDANRSNPNFPRAWVHVTNEAAPKKPWRRVHLLSAQLHGPGNIEANIVPAVERINSRLRDGPEKWGKDEIIAKTTNVGWYRTTVAYGHPAPHDEFPSSVRVQGGFCTVDPNNPANVTPGPAEPAASLSESAPEIPNAPGATVSGPMSIQTSTSRALFAAFSGQNVTQYLAQWLAGKTFASLTDVLAAMAASGDQRISSKAAVVSALMQGPNPTLVP
jgi:Domain of unknown function (DUF4157)